MQADVAIEQGVPRLFRVLITVVTLTIYRVESMIHGERNITFCCSSFSEIAAGGMRLSCGTPERLKQSLSCLG